MRISCYYHGTTEEAPLKALTKVIALLLMFKVLKIHDLAGRSFALLTVYGARILLLPLKELLALYLQ